jgi:hypothetical protein
MPTETDLAAETVAHDSRCHAAEERLAALARTLGPAREHDHAGARAEHGPVRILAEGDEVIEQAGALGNLSHRG